VKRAAILLAATACLAGCGGSSSTTSEHTTTTSTFEYSKEVTENYMKSCTQSPNATHAYCKCTLDKLSQNVSMKDFERIGLSGGKIPARVRDFIVQAAQDCRSKL
jgi:hypothetical protein